MADIITDTWKNPEGAELRAKLFPDGQPTPEEFIRVLAEHVREQIKNKSDS